MYYIATVQYTLHISSYSLMNKSNVDYITSYRHQIKYEYINIFSNCSKICKYNYFTVTPA